MKTDHSYTDRIIRGEKPAILSQLQKAILPLEGIKTLRTDNHLNIGFKPIERCFPNATFPVGCMYEFLSTSSEDIAATNGFVACLLARMMSLGGACIWISSTRTLFPAALNTFEVEPDKIIFIDLKKEKDVLWAIEEALKCNRFTAAIGEIKNVDFKESRRLQLAVEQSRVTGFILRHQPLIVNTIACVSRWKITSLPSELEEEMPGVGFPRWNVELLKVRNGYSGTWKVEWSSNGFQSVKENIFFNISRTKTKIG